MRAHIRMRTRRENRITNAPTCAPNGRNAVRLSPEQQRQARARTCTRTRTARKVWCQHIHMSAPGNRNQETRSCLPTIEARLEAYQVCQFRLQTLVIYSIHRSKPGCAYTLYTREASRLGCALYHRSKETRKPGNQEPRNARTAVSLGSKDARQAVPLGAGGCAGQGTTVRL